MNQIYEKNRENCQRTEMNLMEVKISKIWYSTMYQKDLHFEFWAWLKLWKELRITKSTTATKKTMLCTHRIIPTRSCAKFFLLVAVTNISHIGYCFNNKKTNVDSCARDKYRGYWSKSSDSIDEKTFILNWCYRMIE